MSVFFYRNLGREVRASRDFGEAKRTGGNFPNWECEENMNFRVGEGEEMAETYSLLSCQYSWVLLHLTLEQRPPRLPPGARISVFFGVWTMN